MFDGYNVKLASIYTATGPWSGYGSGREDCYRTMTPKSSTGLAELSSLIDDAVALISGFEKSLKDVVDSNGDSGRSLDPWASEASVTDRKQLDTLALARDVATLIKAHSTKISLFIINEPFTPSAISAVLRQLIEEPIPAIATAVQQCHADLYTKIIRRDLAWRCGRVLKELRELIEKIPKDGKVVPQDKRNGLSGGMAEKGSIITTGLLWGACDEVISFANLGVVGHLSRRAEQFRDTLKDVLEELKEWSDEQDEVDEDEDNDTSEEAPAEDQVDGLANDINNTHISTQAMLDEFMNSSSNIPRDDPEKIKERLASTLRRLRLTVLLYQALTKRRLKTLPKLPLDSADTTSVVISRLDEVMPLLGKITDRFNSLAVAFYDLDSAEITKLMDQCFFDAFAVSELLAKPWDAGRQKDEFTDWVAKFQLEIKKN
ncbi:hypothetical protein N0V93_002463 [Gnomoniopsis smithogilvyi]|uniref:Cyclin-D1-binding protein 1-like N-terminal domain-containing protein n=1 Tax=Gnomoniopsis smithogilvyi TaxID=1191159 RepID=A0A9W8YUU2_9PEZI|nr:hypothetical protein N0V93_002463 [Gnomoniopsis smithogilvyi]